MPSNERENPDSSALAEHLRFVHFVITSCCLIIALALPALDVVSIRRARLSVREILSLESVLNSTGNIVDDGEGWRKQKWLRDAVRRGYGNRLPETALRFSLTHKMTNARLDVEVPRHLRWFVRVKRGENLDVIRPLGSWTVEEWAHFWNGMQNAELEVVPDLNELRAIGYITPARTHFGEWDDVAVSPQTSSTVTSRWTGYVTDDPHNSDDIADYAAAYPTIENTSKFSGWSLIVPTENSGYATEGKASITGVAIDTQHTPIDIQKVIAALAFARWTSGTFEQSFPELSQVTKNKRSIALSEMPSELAQREKLAGKILKIAEIDIRADSLGLWGSILMLAIQLYAMINLAVLGKRLTDDDRAWQFPWIVLYRTPVSYALSILTLCITPVILGAWVLPRIGSSYCAQTSRFCTLSYDALAIGNVAIALVTLVQLHVGFKPRSKLTTKEPIQNVPM